MCTWCSWVDWHLFWQRNVLDGERTPFSRWMVRHTTRQVERSSSISVWRWQSPHPTGKSPNYHFWSRLDVAMPRVLVSCSSVLSRGLTSIQRRSQQASQSSVTWLSYCTGECCRSSQRQWCYSCTMCSCMYSNTCNLLTSEPVSYCLLGALG